MLSFFGFSNLESERFAVEKKGLSLTLKLVPPFFSSLALSLFDKKCSTFA